MGDVKVSLLWAASSLKNAVTFISNALCLQQTYVAVQTEDMCPIVNEFYMKYVTFLILRTLLHQSQ